MTDRPHTSNCSHMEDTGKEMGIHILVHPLCKLFHIHTLEYYSPVKTMHLDICMQMDGTKKKKTSWAR